MRCLFREQVLLACQLLIAAAHFCHPGSWCFKSLIFQQWFTQPLDKGCYFISVLHIAPGNTSTHLQKEGNFTDLQMKSLKTEMSALFALFHTQMWDRRACVLNTSGSFHTKLESRCPPQDISMSTTFACLLCCYMISVSFFFLFPAFMWDCPSLFWPLHLWLWQWPAGSFWTAWSCFIFFCCHCYLPL